ncbi:MAG: hypothetical protein HUK07_05430, partial [Bacteroidaceae bacterium]|nr:hypothetical protein [Bacteroidaceae bacterium]
MAVFAACVDTSEIENDLDRLELRLNKVNRALKEVNGNIAALSEIMEGSVYVTSYTEAQGVCKIGFSDGKSVDITLGDSME